MFLPSLASLQKTLTFKTKKSEEEIFFVIWSKRMISAGDFSYFIVDFSCFIYISFLLAFIIHIRYIIVFVLKWQKKTTTHHFFQCLPFISSALFWLQLKNMEKQNILFYDFFSFIWENKRKKSQICLLLAFKAVLYCSRLDSRFYKKYFFLFGFNWDLKTFCKREKELHKAPKRANFKHQSGKKYETK